MSRLGVWLKRVLVGLLALLLLYQFWLFGWVLWWNWVNPDSTRFMSIRLAELRVKDPQAQLQHRWLAYHYISGQLKRAVIAAEDAKFVDHEGFDWEGIQKAIEKNQQSRTNCRRRFDDLAATRQESLSDPGENTVAQG
jgi:monofunctional biosynthetic peptidoglycan transglycosylase